MHNCLRGNAPNEIQVLLFSTDSYRINRLKQATYSNKYGCRAISYTSPKLWNMLPGYVRDVEETENFKKILKTFLMKNGNKYLRSLQYVWLKFDYLTLCQSSYDLVLHGWTVIIIIINYYQKKEFQTKLHLQKWPQTPNPIALSFKKMTGSCIEYWKIETTRQSIWWIYFCSIN